MPFIVGKNPVKTAHRGCSLNWRANRSHELDILVKWRSAYIPSPKPVEVRFNRTNHVVSHENSVFR